MTTRRHRIVAVRHQTVTNQVRTRRRHRTRHLPAVCLIPFNFLNARMEDARHEMEAAATQLELLLKQQPSVIAAVAHAQHPTEPAPAGV